MAEHGWSVLCVRVIVDKDTRQTTLVDTTDLLWVNAPEDFIDAQIREAVSQDKKGISVPSPLHLVSWWFRSDPDVAEPPSKARVVLVSPGGEVLAGGEFEVDLSVGTGYRAVWPLPQFPLTALGRHYFFVQRPNSDPEKKDEWEVLASLPLDVRARFVQPKDESPTAPTEPVAVPDKRKRRRKKV